MVSRIFSDKVKGGTLVAFCIFALLFLAGATRRGAGTVTLSAIQAATGSDFHTIGGTDDDVPEAGDFAALLLNLINDPGASKTFNMGTYGLKFDWAVDNPGSSVTRIHVQSDALKTDTDVCWVYLEVDANGTPVDVFKICGGSTRPVLTGDLQLNTDSSNYSSIDKFMVNAVHLNDLDFGWTVAQNFTSLDASGAITGKSSLIPQTDPTYDIGANYTACGGRWFQNGDADAIEFTLPAATVGDVCCFADDFGGVISVNPDDGTDYIVVDGTSYGAGDELDTEGNDGDFVCLQGTSTDEWVARGRSGALADGGAA